MADKKLPYSEASSGDNALREAEKILRAFGCDNFGVMNDWARGCVLVQFQWRERRIQLEASWRGYAEMWLKENPWSHKRRSSRSEWEALARKKGEIAAPSILRDWIKAQVTAVEAGLMPFDHAFMPHMLANDGRRVVEHMQSLLLEHKP